MLELIVSVDSRMDTKKICVYKRLDHSRGTYSRSRPYQESIGYWNFNQEGTNFNHVRIDSDMTHVLVLSTKVRRNEQSW